MSIPADSADGGILTANVLQFGRLLRRAGLEVDTGQTATFLRAMNVIGLDRRSDVRAAGRAIFTRRRDDQELYDAAFDLFWRRRGPASGPSERLPRIRQDSRREFPADPGHEMDAKEAAGEVVPTVLPQATSDREILRSMDFAFLTPAEARDAQAMLEALRPKLPMRRSRRSAIDRGGHRPAMRAMLRLALSTGGEALRWRWLKRTERARPIVLICDISGSMERYSRFMLRFAHALRRSGARLEVFVFGTRHSAASDPEPRCSAQAGGREGRGLERRHENRREPARAQPPLGEANRAERGGGVAGLRRVGARRSSTARSGDGHPAALVSPVIVDRSARGTAGIRAGHGRPQSSVTARRRACAGRERCLARGAGLPTAIAVSGGACEIY